MSSVSHQPPVGPMRILIIDDDPLLLKSLRDALEGEGHDVTVGVRRSGGHQRLRRSLTRWASRFPLVITDLGMPHVDGRKVAATIKASAPDTVVIMLTGWGRRLVAEGEMPPGVDTVISKPPKLLELRAVLANHFSKGVAPGRA